MNRHTTFSVLPAICVLLGALLAGCSSAPHRAANHLLEAEQWAEAEQVLDPIAAEHRDDPRVWRDLGRAQLAQRRYDEAIGSLQTAMELDASDPAVPLLLGLAHEGLSEWDDAIEAYQAYPGTYGRSSVSGAVRGRMADVVRAIYAERAENALEEPERIGPRVLLVRYFDVLADIETYGQLGKGMTDQLIEDFARLDGMHVVDRLRYQETLRAVERARSDGFDPLAAYSLGELIGAGYSLGGTITPSDERDEIRIEYYLVNHVTGETKAPTTITGTLSEFFELEKRIVAQVSEEIGAEMSRAVRRTIGQIPTTNFRAFLAYADGIDADDQGDTALARERFEEAITLDPLFHLAIEQRERLDGTPAKILWIARRELQMPFEAARRGRLQTAQSLLTSQPTVLAGESEDVSSVRPLGLGSAIIRVRVDDP